MLTRLVDARIPHPLLVSGIVWGLWHVPLILSGQYAAGPSPALSAVLFVVAIVPESYVIGRVRLASGSVWPAVIMHASWNSIVQGPFDRHTVGGDAARAGSVWIGESGMLVVLASFLVAFFLVRRGVVFRRTPADEPLVMPLRDL